MGLVGSPANHGVNVEKPSFIYLTPTHMVLVLINLLVSQGGSLNGGLSVRGKHDNISQIIPCVPLSMCGWHPSTLCNLIGIIASYLGIEAYMIYLLLYQTKDLVHCFAQSRDSGCVWTIDRGKENKARK